LRFWQCDVLTVHKHDGCVRGWEGLPIEQLGTGKHFQEAEGETGPEYTSPRTKCFCFLRREFHASVSVGSKVTKESSVEISADSIMEVSVCRQC